MANITSAMIKELRDRTQAGMLDCKKALTEVDGNMEAAVDFLRKKGLAAANKRADRDAKEGIVLVDVADDKKIAKMMMFNCETDFVAKNEDFKVLAESIMEKFVAAGVKEHTKEGELIPEVDEAIKTQIATSGENTFVGGFTTMEVTGEGIIANYVHSNSKLAVLLEINCEKAETAAKAELEELGKDLCMQVAAANPQYLVPAEVPVEALEKEKDIYREQMKNSGKPANILEKIIEGKLGKFYSEVCLLNQDYVKDPKVKINDLVAKTAKDLDDKITVSRFTRYQIGA